MSEANHTILRALRAAAGKGSLLEKATCAVLRDFGFRNVTRQSAGTQFGFDIHAECLNNENEWESWKVECKNLGKRVTPTDIAPKLLWQLFGNLVDHYLLVTTSTLSNEARYLLESHNFAFPITVWDGQFLAAQLSNSPSACAILELDFPAEHKPPSGQPLVFLPKGDLKFDVMHQHAPPREFAYFRDGPRVIKAFTANEFKLDVFLSNRGSTEMVVRRIRCVTRQFSTLKDRRVLIQNKPKGFFSPEKILFTPSRTPGESVELLGERMVRVRPGATEAIRLELSDQAGPGYYELQLAASTHSGRGDSSTGVIPLVISGSGESTANVVVMGRHYDDPVPRLLDLDEKRWSLLAAPANPPTLRVLGQTMEEIISGADAPDKWRVRDVSGELVGDGTISTIGAPISTVVELGGPVGEPCFSLDDAKRLVEGDVERIRLGRQISRRHRLVGRGET